MDLKLIELICCLYGIFIGDLVLLNTLMSDLKWLRSTVKYGATFHLLAYYRNLKEKLSEQVRLLVFSIS